MKKTYRIPDIKIKCFRHESIMTESAVDFKHSDTYNKAVEELNVSEENTFVITL